MGGPYVMVETAAAAPLPPPTAVRTVAGPIFAEVRACWQGSVALSLQK
jgi:hypothetical protein